MAIAQNAFIEFFGTQDSLDSTSGSVADTAFSVAGDLDTYTNVDDAPFASIVFEGDFAAAVDANSVVELYAQQLNIVGTSGEEVPDANNLSGFLGTFGLNDVATAMFKAIVVKLPNVKSQAVFQFFVRNSAGQSLDAGWDLHVTSIAIGPHA